MHDRDTRGDSKGGESARSGGRGTTTARRAMPQAHSVVGTTNEATAAEAEGLARPNERVGRRSDTDDSHTWILSFRRHDGQRAAATLPARSTDTHTRGRQAGRTTGGTPRPSRSRWGNLDSRERREGQGRCSALSHRAVLLLIVIIHRIAVNNSESEELLHIQQFIALVRPPAPFCHPRPSRRRALPRRPQDSVDWRSASRRNRGGDTRKRAKGGRKEEEVFPVCWTSPSRNNQRRRRRQRLRGPGRLIETEQDNCGGGGPHSRSSWHGTNYLSETRGLLLRAYFS